MSHDTLSGYVEATAATFGIPGVAVGVWADGREDYACHGMTSVDNPLPVDRDTLYVLGSVTKTYTATALMRLAAAGQVELDAPVRRYVPELVLADERTAAEVTVLNLLNHTSGLGWDILTDTGEGDDALARFVPKLAELELVAPLGARASYSQAGYSLLGRVIEKVAGMPYEKAMASLVFDPLGLSHSFFAPVDVMTRRFAVGHNRGEDGTMPVAWLWRGPRYRNAGGGLASSVADQLRWARFHLGDGRAQSGSRILPAEMLHRMKEPTAELRGSSLGRRLFHPVQHLGGQDPGTALSAAVTEMEPAQRSSFATTRGREATARVTRGVARASPRPHDGHRSSSPRLCPTATAGVMTSTGSEEAVATVPAGRRRARPWLFHYGIPATFSMTRPSRL